jgi:hypothetical protein
VAGTDAPRSRAHDESVTGSPDCEHHASRAVDEQLAGEHRRALYLYELALKCGGRTPALDMRLFKAACDTADRPKSRRYFLWLSSASRTQLAQICIRNGITWDELNQP